MNLYKNNYTVMNSNLVPFNLFKTGSSMDILEEFEVMCIRWIKQSRLYIEWSTELSN